MARSDLYRDLLRELIRWANTAGPYRRKLVPSGESWVHSTIEHLDDTFRHPSGGGPSIVAQVDDHDSASTSATANGVTRVMHQFLDAPEE